MKKLWMKLIALCLAAALLLSGCNSTEFWLFLEGHTAFTDMKYTRPDVDAARKAAEELEKQLQEKHTAESLMDYVYAFYAEYHNYYTNYALADIYYCKDMTDLYWGDEYTYCMDNGTEMDKLLDRILRELASSALKEELEAEEYFGAGFFDDYLGESLWTEAFTALMERESALVSKYYELNEQALEAPDEKTYYEVYGAQMSELFVELVALRQQIAEEAGHESYPDFAYDFYYDRDYTPQQAQVLLDEIHTELVPLYREKALSDVWLLGQRECFEKKTFEYVKNCAAAMGGTVQKAFRLMEGAGLYDISYGKNKYNASFSIYLTSYNEPYIFMNPSLLVRDQLTFAHEFGHFCNDYASNGSVAGIDVAEIFSQGMEFLSLCYGENTKDLQKIKMVDSLSVYVEQAAYASFEQQVYNMAQEELTAENIQAVFEQTGNAYGFDVWHWDSRSYVSITHFFTSPLYVISYVVSNDAALQIYQLEREEKGAGLKLYESQLATTEGQFLAFIESAGLESPFVEGRLVETRKLLEELLK
jgi:hypothetical protein